MSKQSMREEAERLIRETMEKRNLVIKQGNTRIEAVCGKCGAPNRVQAEKGATRVKFACKQCGHKQEDIHSSLTLTGSLAPNHSPGRTDLRACEGHQRCHGRMTCLCLDWDAYVSGEICPRRITA